MQGLNKKKERVTRSENKDYLLNKVMMNHKKSNGIC